MRFSCVNLGFFEQLTDIIISYKRKFSIIREKKSDYTRIPPKREYKSMLYEEFTFSNQFVQNINEMRGNDSNCTEQLLKYLTQSVSMFNDQY